MWQLFPIAHSRNLIILRKETFVESLTQVAQGLFSIHVERVGFGSEDLDGSLPACQPSFSGSEWNKIDVYLAF